MDRDARKKRQVQVQTLLKSVEGRLLEIPGVKTVAVGLKVTNGKMTDDIVLRIGVEEKRPISELSPEEMIPSEIDGIETDVFVWTPTKAMSDTSRYRPIRGGIQIGNGTGSVGTLGCLATQNSGGATVALSNHHVMFAGKSATATGIEIAQPDFSCCCCCRAGKVGAVLAGSIGGTVDCAIASIDADIQHLQEVVEIGGIAGTGVAVVGDAVRKRGRTTELTTGTVSMVNFATTSSDSGLSFTDQIFVTPDAAHPNFVEGGDSGSALLDEDNNVIGLIWGQNGNAGVANPIADVEAALDITVFAQSTTAAAMPAVAMLPQPGSDGVIRRRDWEAMLWAETDSQDLLGRKVAQHWNEVWNLILTNREVGLRWQRGQGPAFAAAFERTTRVTSYRVPDDVDGVSFTQLLLSMATALEQHGSEALKADIRAEGIGWIPILQGCRTADELWLAYHNIKATQEAAARNAG